MENLIYAHRARSRKRWRFRLYLLGGVLLLLGVLGLAGVKNAPFLKIREISVAGVGEENRPTLLASLREIATRTPWQRFLGSDHILAWPDKFETASPVFSRITMTRNLFERSLALEASLREPYGIWCTQSGEEERCLWFDQKDGIAMTQAPVPEGTLVFKVTEANGGSLVPGEPVLSGPRFKNFLAVLEIMDTERLPVKSITLDTSLEELRAETFPGATIIWSLRFDPTPVAARGLKAFLEKTSLEKIEYLNLTVENKIYLKER